MRIITAKTIYILYILYIHGRKYTYTYNGMRREIVKPMHRVSKLVNLFIWNTHASQNLELVFQTRAFRIRLSMLTQNSILKKT
jgi:hypothetical protein